MDLEGFLPSVAKNASAAAEGLCTWVRSMKYYHEASKVVKPKLEALAIAEGQMEAANRALEQAEKRLQGCKNMLAELQLQFERQMSEKKRIEDGAAALARKMNQAEELIGGLAGEQERWTEDARNFADLKTRLVGDCAVACAFVSYLGPFNQDFRTYCIDDKFVADCEARGVPVTPHLNVTALLVDIGTIGDWNMQGLPTDALSIQNGILVTRSSRFPLLIDPQGQALNWIRQREEQRMPAFGSITISSPKLKDNLEFCMAEGKALVVTGVEQEVDPMLDPVLEKQIIVKAKSKQIVIADKSCDYDDAFMLYFITRLPNPHFSPELQAKTTVVDFTVTQKGLEEQLLGKVIGNEQKALEEQLNQVLQEVNSNTKALLSLDAMLLERLTSNTGNLLDDEELIVVLNNTKTKAKEVKEKLIAADETKENINEKREQFRPVATRGSVLYFSIVEISLANPMYQISLDQFLALFLRSMDEAEKSTLASR
jgi:dynein heavy chain